MTTLTWNLSTVPASAPEYWMLFVDGSALCSLENQAPYVGPGKYSVNLTQLDAGVLPPVDGLPHNYSVALVGGGSIGPQSAAVAITLPVPVVTVVTAQPPPPPVWPAADTVSFS